MAGPLIEMLQGLRDRRQRRRSGWGGGDSPAMRDMINPLDSQEMTDRSQGVDISEAMPATRLEAKIPPQQQPEPQGGAAITAQLTGGRGPIQTAAGSNAPEKPVSQANFGGQQQQYFDQPAQCTGPNCGNVVSERVTHINGVPVGGATASAGQATAGQATAAMPVGSPFEAWQGFMATAVDNPRGTNWAEAGNAAMKVAENFYNRYQSAGSPTEKAIFHGQFVYWARESANAFKAHQLAQNLAPRQQMAEQAMNRGTLKSQFQEAADFLTTPNLDVGPDDRAAAYAQTVLSKTTGKPLTPAEIQAHPTYQKARRVAHAADIADEAAIAASASPTLNPWGFEETRKAGIEPAYNKAKGYYGSMSMEDAASEIEERFKPAYIKALTRMNEARVGKDRLSADQIRAEADVRSQALISSLHYDQELGWSQEPGAAQEQPQAAAPAVPADGWWRAPKNSGWEGL